ncbi:MAG: LLM class flavin-dependent oxidoreductase [Actinobacteria bacterium]|nr:LLM class flavin-dependent oxidoreductase [Actinomycetota bacterium]
MRQREDGSVQYGFVVPWADATDIGAIAEAAERHGWDGLFVWEPVWGVDAWVSLAVAACHTSTIRLGTLLTPLPRRKPWELAGQVATVDRLSGGRVVLTVGLGAPDAGYASFGEITDRRTRAELLDEGLAVLRGLWKGQPFEHDGTHYRISPCDFPAIGHTAQQPGVPIWCVGAVGSARSMQRALSCDGLLPQVVHDGQAAQCSLDELRTIALPTDRPADRPFDVIVEGGSTEHAPAAWAEAGATWWIESMWGAMGEADPVGSALDRLRAGPPD